MKKLKIKRKEKKLPKNINSKHNYSHNITQLLALYKRKTMKQNE